jgi:integrase
MKSTEQLLNEYFKFKLGTNKSGTMKTRETRVSKPLHPARWKAPTAIGPEEMASLLNKWGEGKKASTVRSGIQEVKAFWCWLRMKKVITPVQWSKVWDDELLVMLPSQYKRARKMLPQHRVDGATQLLNYLLPLAEAEPGGAATIALLGLTMGFRIGEIFKFTAEDLDYGGRLLWVTDPKTEEGQRQVEVPSILVPILARVKEVRGRGVLFPFNNNQMYRRIKNLCAAAGTRPLGSHALRRTNATLRTLGEQNPDAVIRALGHTDFSMTEGHYVAPGTVEKVGQRRVAKVLNLNQ